MHYGTERVKSVSFYILVDRCAILKQLVTHTASSLDGRDRRFSVCRREGLYIWIALPPFLKASSLGFLRFSVDTESV